MKKTDQAILQGITALIVFFALSKDNISSFLSDWFSGSQIVIPLGAFMLLYSLLVYLYNSFFYRLIHKENFLGGNWIYSVHNHITDKRRYGIFKVYQKLDGIKILSGEVWIFGEEPHDNNQRGTWHSISASVSESELQFIFSMQTLAREEQVGNGQEVQGLFKLNLIKDDNKITRMNGKYFDHLERAGMHGSIQAQLVTEKSRDSLKKKAFEAFGN